MRREAEWTAVTVDVLTVSAVGVVVRVRGRVFLLSRAQLERVPEKRRGTQELRLRPTDALRLGLATT